MTHRTDTLKALKSAQKSVCSHILPMMLAATALSMTAIAPAIAEYKPINPTAPQTPGTISGTRMSATA